MSVPNDLLTVAAHAKADQAGTPVRRLRRKCMNDSGPRSAYTWWGACQTHRPERERLDIRRAPRVERLSTKQQAGRRMADSVCVERSGGAGTHWQ